MNAKNPRRQRRSPAFLSPLWSYKRHVSFYLIISTFEARIFPKFEAALFARSASLNPPFSLELIGEWIPGIFNIKCETVNYDTHRAPFNTSLPRTGINAKTVQFNTQVQRPSAFICECRSELEPSCQSSLLIPSFIID